MTVYGDYGPYFKDKDEYERWLKQTILHNVSDLDLDFVATYDWSKDGLIVKRSPKKQPPKRP